MRHVSALELAIKLPTVKSKPRAGQFRNCFAQLATQSLVIIAFFLHTQSILCRLERKADTIMASQVEVAAELRTANTQLRKLIADTAGIQPAVDALNAKIVELEALVAAGGTVTQELVDAVAETKTLAQAVDDNVPELPTPPTP